MNKAILLSCVAGVSLSASGAMAGMIYASSVENFDQWDRKNGSSPSGDRSDPLKALGAPQLTDTLNFVSLGMGGSIVLGFDSAFNGGSVTVWETTYGNPSRYPESASVWVGSGETWDVAEWYFVADLPNDQDATPLSLAGIGTSDPLRFVRLIDTTDPSIHGGSADGFDVDGVAVYAVPTPGSAALACLGLVMGARTRRRGA